MRVCTASSTQPSCGIYFHAKACFCLAAERRYYLPSYTKLLHTWQFIFCMISQKSIRSCKDKYEIAAANWCGLGGTPLIMLSGRVGLGLSMVYLASPDALIKSADDLWMNSQLAVPSLPMVLQGLNHWPVWRQWRGGDHILRSCVCSVARRGSGCGGWPNEDAALCHEWKQQQQWKQLLAFQRKESTALFLWMFEPVSSPGLNTVQKTVWRRLIAPVNL